MKKHIIFLFVFVSTFTNTQSQALSDTIRIEPGLTATSFRHLCRLSIDSVVQSLNNGVSSFDELSIYYELSFGSDMEVAISIRESSANAEMKMYLHDGRDWYYGYEKIYCPDYEHEILQIPLVGNSELYYLKVTVPSWAAVNTDELSILLEGYDYNQESGFAEIGYTTYLGYGDSFAYSVNEPVDLSTHLTQATYKHLYYYYFSNTEKMDITVSTCETGTWNPMEISLLDARTMDPEAPVNCMYELCNSNYNILKSHALPPGEYCILVTLTESCNYAMSITGTKSLSGSSIHDPALGRKFSNSFQYTDQKDTRLYRNEYSHYPFNDVFYRFTLTKEMDITLSHISQELNESRIFLITDHLICIGEYDCNQSLNQNIFKYPGLLPGSYYVVSEGKDGNGIITTSIRGEVLIKDEIILPGDKNYKVTLTPTVPMEHTDNLSDRNALRTVRYYDGWGRPQQIVQKGITPSGGDLVSLVEYDWMGRDSRQWLPIPSPGNNGDFALEEELKEESHSFYNDAHPFSEPVYESSFRSRIMASYGPGNDWRQNDKKVQLDYVSNTSQGILSCKKYRMTGETSFELTGTYPENTMYVQTEADEDGNTSYVFKDMAGQMVLSRRINNGEFHDTYFVYDQSDNLCYVLPPLASEELTSTSITYTPALEAVDQYAYIYRYDYRNRCVAKKIPGADWIHFVYDKSDRLILSQDGEQRANNKNEWSFTKYDSFGRVIVTGVYTDTHTHEQLCHEIGNLLVVEQVLPGHYGYSWNILPRITFEDVLTINYYDDYEHLLSQGDYFRNNFSYSPREGYGTRYENPGCPACSAKGLLTGTRVKMLDGSEEIITTAFYYDEKGRIIQQISNNHLYGYEKEYYAYSFTGQVMQSLLEHTTPQHTITERYRHTYDHAGRLIDTWYRIDNEPEILQTSLGYDDLGRLKTKNLHNRMDSVTYSYNIRNWLKNIQSRPFNEELFYQESGAGRTPCYNGNISGANYNQMGFRDNFNYQYDGLSRLLYSGYSGSSPDNAFDEEFAYDKHGNLTMLYRKGAVTPSAHVDNNYHIVDYLEYTLDGNQIKSITNYGRSSGFYQSPYFADQTDWDHPDDPEYLYDRNGSMIQDFNKGITKIEYNLLHLPDRMQMTAGHSIRYGYDASGVKRRVESVTAKSTVEVPMGTIRPLPDDEIEHIDIQDYCGNVVYEGNGATILRLLTPEGYLKKRNNSSWEHIYQFKDHLGSVRYECNENQETKGSASYYASGVELVRYNLSMESPYRFMAKEYQQMHGLNMYDVHARFLDMAKFRWDTMDPLCEMYYDVSPYVYCHNNPLRFIDSNGRQARAISSGNKFYRMYKAYKVARAVEGVGFWGAVVVAISSNQMVSGDKSEEVGNSLVERANLSTSPEYQNQRKREKEGKEKLDQNQANVQQKVITGGQNPQDPGGEFNSNNPDPSTILKAIGIGTAGAIVFEQITPDGNSQEQQEQQPQEQQSQPQEPSVWDRIKNFFNW